MSRDRFRGALLGLAVGDALGAAVEFMPPGSFEPVTGMRGGGKFKLRPGEWTDDTSMALCLAESLVERRRFDPIDQMGRYVRWYRGGYLSSNGKCFDIGNATRKALEGFEANGAPYQGAKAPDAAGNAPIMRLAPVPLAFANDPEAALNWAGESARTTHGDDRAIHAAKYLAALILGALKGEYVTTLLHNGIFYPYEGAWEAHPLHPDVAAVAQGSFSVKAPPAIKGATFVVSSLEAALWAFHHHRPFEAGALAAVNLGDDADTTGAVYGQLAGAYYGASAIPEEWLQKLAKRDQITALADGLYELALSEGASPDRSPRPPVNPPDEPEPELPGDSYSVLGDQLLAGEYPGAKTLDAAKAKLARYLDYGVTVFIDLTEEGEGPPLHPYAGLLKKLAKERGVSAKYFRHPIPDQGVPEEWQMRATLSLIAAAISSGEKVHVHCWGGVGRTGTVVGCALRETGAPPEIVLDLLASMRAKTSRANKHSPETAEQRDYVLTWQPEPATITLDQEQIDAIQPIPVPDEAESGPEIITTAPELALKLRGGPEAIDGPGPGWVVQGLVEIGKSWLVEVLDPVKWGRGPALPEDQMHMLEELGFAQSDAGWSVKGIATPFQSPEAQAAELMLTVAHTLWDMAIPLDGVPGE